LNNVYAQSKLPFFYLPKINLKILIDSGATDSIINKNAAEQFSEFYFQEQFTVTSMNKSVTSVDNLEVPLLHEIGIITPIKLRIIDWHNRFDVLIGTKDLEKFQAQINYKDRMLTLLDKKLPFHLEYNNTAVNFSNNETKKLCVPVTIEEGEVLIPPIEFKGQILTPECIAYARNGVCVIPNSFGTEVNFSERIEALPTTVVDLQNPISKIKNSPNIKNVIRTQHLNTEERERIIELCSQFRDVFYYENSDLTFTSKVKHQIRTTDDRPIYSKSYRYPRAMQQEINDQIQKLLDDKIIRPSISPYSSPVWVVPKKLDASGKRKHRMVIDYRKLNEVTVEDKYPIPRIDEILDNLGKCTYFTTLDLAQGFHQIEVDSNSIEKTAFSVNNGHFEYLRMPFGLKNAPATFQRMMDEILKEYLYRFCFVYMDDIVIFSKSLHDHIIHIKMIFQKLRNVNLKIQLDKSEFLCKEVAFLGHLITPEGIKPNPSKIDAIQKYPIPRTIKEIKSFMGLVGYYRRFISNFAKLTSPLTKCLKKGSKININDPDYIESFENCKELLINAPILKYPDFEKPFRLTTDASNVAIGGVLSQNNQPIGYYSRTLNSAEKNYSTIEKELLAVIACCKHFRPYLFGKKFTIETDHNPLVWLSKIGVWFDGN
jgi:RNase H-like domain found in reverse transcriptase/Reverse transcriptase (RNA-dependent DNA polymerase)